MNEDELIAITGQCYDAITTEVPDDQQKIVVGLLVQLILGKEIHQLPESIKEETLIGYLEGYKDFILTNPFREEDLGGDFLNGNV